MSIFYSETLSVREFSCLISVDGILVPVSGSFISGVSSCVIDPKL